MSAASAAPVHKELLALEEAQRLIVAGDFSLYQVLVSPHNRTRFEDGAFMSKLLLAGYAALDECAGNPGEEAASRVPEITRLINALSTFRVEASADLVLTALAHGNLGNAGTHIGGITADRLDPRIVAAVNRALEVKTVSRTASDVVENGWSTAQYMLFRDVLLAFPAEKTCTAMRVRLAELSEHSILGAGFKRRVSRDAEAAAAAMVVLQQYGI